MQLKQTNRDVVQGSQYPSVVNALKCAQCLAYVPICEIEDEVRHSSNRTLWIDQYLPVCDGVDNSGHLE